MQQDDIQQDQWKQLAGNAAANLVEDGMVIGIGSGTTSTCMIRALAQSIRAGLHIVGAVPSSRASQDLAVGLGIPITDLDTYPDLDLYIDGADEIDPLLNLIKGGGGALLREKVVASAAHRFIVIADITKQVPLLGQKCAVPVEVIPFAVTPVRRRLQELEAVVQLRQHDGQPYITDNGNMILDCTFPGGISDPVETDARMQRIVGVIETGLFLGMAQGAIIGGPQGVKTIP
jgi:ribose 5-phosphate isomerase A